MGVKMVTYIWIAIGSALGDQDVEGAADLPQVLVPGHLLLQGERQRFLAEQWPAVHATILRLLGFDHTKLTSRYNGRDFRLTDNFGNVVKDIIA